MAPIRLPGFGRVPFALAALVCIAVAVPAVAARAEPGNATTPTVASVTASLDTLARRTERLAETYNAARAAVTTAERRLGATRRASVSANNTYEAARARFVATIRAEYQGAPSGAMFALLGSADQQDYLDTLGTLDVLSKERADTVSALADARARSQRAQRTAATQLQQARAARDAVKRQRAVVRRESDKYHSLLVTLTAQQQRAYTQRDAATIDQTHGKVSVHAPNAAAQKAVDFALGQLGKPYVFGAAGPATYDCSGLTMAAWQAAGVSLPHLASAQYDAGRHVGIDELQPGDLVFLYHPIDHVSIYIGHGMVVSAPQTGETVKIVRLAYFRGDFTGATRLS